MQAAGRNDKSLTVQRLRNNGDKGIIVRLLSDNYSFCFFELLSMSF